MQIDTNELRKKALGDQLGGDLASFSAPPAAPSAPDPIGGPLQAAGGPAIPASGSTPPGMGDNKPAAPKSPFQSANTSVRGYLDEAARAFAPTVHGIKDEAGRKSAVQSYLQSLIPEIESRGGSISDIRNEKARVDGRMIDFYRDIEGAAEPQYLDVTDEGGGGQMPIGGPAFGGIPLDGALDGDPLAKIQQAISQLSGSRPNFDALLQELGGVQ